MATQLFSKAELVSLVRPHGPSRAWLLGFAVAGLSIGAAQAAVQAASGPRAEPVPIRLELPATAPAAKPAAPVGPAWVGLDLDGDGAPDFANPTGEAPRGHDAFGDGYFHARRDGGSRDHEGVDYDAQPGQAVEAPISGYVSKIGYAYPGDERFKYVEIDNPALRVTARVFYVDPQVGVGQAVALGHEIGTAHSLQARYAGITNHVHLEIEERGRKVDATRLIVAQGPTAIAAGMN